MGGVGVGVGRRQGGRLKRLGGEGEAAQEQADWGVGGNDLGVGEEGGVGEVRLEVGWLRGGDGGNYV